jgi:hypothetical protein
MLELARTLTISKMSGEIIKANTFKEAKDQLTDIYRAKSRDYKEISKEEYEGFEASEREDSDNHINEERHGEDTEIIDLAWYKYLSEGWTAYKIILKHTNGETQEYYFKIKPDVT